MPNEQLTIIGWGQTETESKSSVLREIQLRAMSLADAKTYQQRVNLEYKKQGT
jgi:hypothetical protein